MECESEEKDVWEFNMCSALYWTPVVLLHKQSKNRSDESFLKTFSKWRRPGLKLRLCMLTTILTHLWVYMCPAKRILQLDACGRARAGCLEVAQLYIWLECRDLKNNKAGQEPPSTTDSLLLANILFFYSKCVTCTINLHHIWHVWENCPSYCSYKEQLPV